MNFLVCFDSTICMYQYLKKNFFKHKISINYHIISLRKIIKFVTTIAYLKTCTFEFFKEFLSSLMLFTLGLKGWELICQNFTNYFTTILLRILKRFLIFLGLLGYKGILVPLWTKILSFQAKLSILILNFRLIFGLLKIILLFWFETMHIRHFSILKYGIKIKLFYETKWKTLKKTVSVSE